jgi:DNA-binding transcriptional ArsR family regulator
MARAATTLDAWNAVAEARRRQILDVLAGGERGVTDLGALLDLPQPQVSKHLRVLREVGLVQVREQGRERVYRLNAESLKPLADWLENYERLWTQRLDRLDAVVRELRAAETAGEGAGHDNRNE